VTTAEALEGITDFAKFEIFAMNALHVLDSDFRLAIQLGVNAQGKTIPAPLDGFAIVPGWDPPKYAFAAMTTTPNAGLQAKWLAQRDLPFDATTRDAGDLVKAAREADNIRLRIPTAQFRVALVTNHEVSLKLYKTVDEYAKLHGLVCNIISRSRLTAFLDADADGNYQREWLLDIRQTRLSRDLLHDIGEKSFQRFEAEMLDAIDAPWISEGYEERIGESLRSSPVTVLVGDSGRGKSILCLHVGRSLLRTGGLALWCPPECFDNALSLEAALLAALRAVRSDLDDRAGKAALDFARSEQMVLIIDDVNRLRDAQHISRRVARRVLAEVIAGPKASYVSKLRLVLPLSTKNAGFLKNEDAEDAVTVVTMGSMAHAVATQIVAALPATSSSPVGNKSADVVAQSLCNDPFLIALWRRFRERHDHAPQTAAILDHYLNQCCDVAAAKSDALLTPDIGRALLVLGARMLASRQLQPAYHDVISTLSEDERRAVRSLLSDANLCKIVIDGPRQSIVFRHDRLRDFVLAKSVIDHPPEDTALIADPLFADIVAIVTEHPDTPKEDLATLVRANPLAVAMALGDSNTLCSDRRRAVEALFVEWWTTSTRSGSGWQAAARDASIEWWTSHATSIASRLYNDEVTARFLIGARLGDVEEAIRLCATTSVRVSAPWRDDAIRHGANLQGGEMREQVRTLLRRPLTNDIIRAGALGLAGLLGGRELTGPAIDCWRHADDRTSVFAEAVFAVLQTSDDPVVDMEPLLDHFETIDRSRPNETDASPHFWATHEIPWLVTHKPNPRLIDWLWHVDESRPGLRLDVLRIALTLFTPEAVPLIAHVFGRIESEHGAEAAAIQRMINDSHRGVERPIIVALKKIWLDDQKPPVNRRQALAMCQGFLSAEDIGDLAAAHATGIFQDSILRARLKLGDLAVAGDLVARLMSDGRIERWVEYCAGLWSDSTVRSTFRSILERRAEELRLSDGSLKIIDAMPDIDYHIAQTLNRLEPEAVEELLTPLWEKVSRYGVYLQCALAANTPELSRRFASVIAETENPAAAFRFVVQRSTRQPDDARSVEPFALVPYLQYFDQQELGFLADWTNRQSKGAWRRAHIDDLLDEKTRRRYAPSPVHLLEFLKEDLGRSLGDIEFWFRRLELTGYSMRAGLDMLRQRFVDESSDATFGAFNKAVMLHGDRSDVAWLSEHTREDRAEAVAYTQFVVYRRTSK
jgi:hypothetical protein